MKIHRTAFVLALVAGATGVTCKINSTSGNVCGDGAWNNATEECDDGNTTSADGCSSTCTIEPGFACTNPLNLNTGSDAKGGQAAIDGKDPIWSYAETLSGPLTPATVAGTCAKGAWVEPPPYATWVNRYGCQTTSPGDNDTYYRATFTLTTAAAAASTVLKGAVWADNAISNVYVNDVATGFSVGDPAFKGGGISLGAWPSTLYKEGTNTVTVVVHNAHGGAGNPDGLLVALDYANVHSVCIKACGDGVVEAIEECDHGSRNGASGDSCDSSCKKIVACGVDGGAPCDGGVEGGVDGGSDADASAGDAADGGLDAADGGDAACGALLTLHPNPTALSPDDTALAVADFNGDTKLDAVISSRGVNKMAFLQGVGDGTFVAPVLYATDQNPLALAAADLNADNNIDVVVATAGSVSSVVDVLLGNGNGTFQAKVSYPAGNGASGVAIVDLGNGKPDVLVANSTDATVSVFIGNGSGTLAAKVDYAVGQTPGPIAVGKLNADASPDVVVVNTGDSTVSVLLGNGNGTLQTKVDYATDTTPTAIALGDINGDGAIDIVTANATNTMMPSVLSVLLGNGNGTFRAKTSIVTGLYPNGVALVDIDGDTKLDIVAACSGDSVIAVHRGNGNATFKPIETFSTGANTGPASLSVAKLNADNRLDVLAVASSTDQAVVLLNTCGP